MCISGQRDKEQTPPSWTATYFLGLSRFLVSKFSHAKGSETPVNEPQSHDYQQLTDATAALSLPVSEKSSSSSVQLSFSSLPYELFHRPWKDLKAGKRFMWPLAGENVLGGEGAGHLEQACDEHTAQRNTPIKQYINTAPPPPLPSVGTESSGARIRWYGVQYTLKYN